MSPPIRDGSGNSIGSIRLGDGSEIAEVRTGAGDVLFSASAGTSMFQSPIYQFTASEINAQDGTSPVNYPEVLAGLPDATTTTDPTFRASFKTTGLQAVEYDSNDFHNVSTDSQIPNNGEQISIFVLYFNTANQQNGLAAFGNTGEAFLEADTTNNEYRVNVSGANSFSGGSAPLDQLTTMGFAYDDSSNQGELFGNGVSAATASTSIDMSSHNLDIGGGNTSKPPSGAIMELIVCDTKESLTAYQQYHNDRTS